MSIEMEIVNMKRTGNRRAAILAAGLLIAIFVGACGGGGSSGGSGASGASGGSGGSGGSSGGSSLMPPAAPASLNGTAGNAQVTLNWGAVAGASDYEIARATAAGGPYVALPVTTSTSYIDTGLANGTTYFYVAYAVNSAGTSASSPTFSATPQVVISPPAPPANVVATPGINQVALSWSAVDGATSYIVQRASAMGGPFAQIGTTTAPATTYTDSGLSNTALFFYAVVAVNAAGDSSASAAVSATPQGASCSFNGATLASGTTVPAFLAPSVASGLQCSTVAVTAICSNGAMTPTNAVPSCSVQRIGTSLVSHLDAISPSGTVTGWAYDPASPATPLAIEAFVDGPSGVGTPLAPVASTITRSDINTKYGIGGMHGFAFDLPAAQLGAVHLIYVYAVGANGLEQDLLANAPMTSPPSVQGATTVPMPASVVSTTLGFEKYIFSFPIAAPPAGKTNALLALTGNVSIQIDTPNFTEVLASIYFDAHGCPANGQPGYATYPSLDAANPGLALIEQIIVKAATKGESSVPVNTLLPVAQPMPGAACIGVILDGGGGNRTVTMISALNLTYVTETSPASGLAPYNIGMGGEFCFAQNSGCQARTTDPTQQFANVQVAKASGTLIALFGDISDSAETIPPLPNGPWGASNDFYLIPGGCGAAFTPATGNSFVGPAKLTTLLPGNAVLLFSAPLTGTGQVSLHASVMHVLPNVPLHAGDCLVTIFGRSGQNTSDDETQVRALVVP